MRGHTPLVCTHEPRVQPCTQPAPPACRVLGMVDGCVLLVDVAEGPMAQTKYVLTKALNMRLRPLVVLNKMDRDAATAHRCDVVHSTIFDLFASLGADDHQLDFPIIYASGAPPQPACLSLRQLPPASLARSVRSRAAGAADSFRVVRSQRAPAGRLLGRLSGIPESMQPGRECVRAGASHKACRVTCWRYPGTDVPGTPPRKRMLRAAPQCYAGKAGWATAQYPEAPGTGMEPLLDAIVRHVPPPALDTSGQFRMLVTMTEHDAFLGRIATGRVAGGRVALGGPIWLLPREGNLVESGKVPAPRTCLPPHYARIRQPLSLAHS